VYLILNNNKYTRHRTKTNNEEWNSPEKLARLGTQDTRTKTNNEEWNNPEKLARLSTQDTGQRQTMKNVTIQRN
jgi:hypothetical protein